MIIFGLETPISLRVRNLHFHTYRCEDLVSRIHLIYGIKMGVRRSQSNYVLALVGVRLKTLYHEYI
jgi:hypothetical protein